MCNTFPMSRVEFPWSDNLLFPAKSDAQDVFTIIDTNFEIGGVFKSCRQKGVPQNAKHIITFY